MDKGYKFTSSLVLAFFLIFVIITINFLIAEEEKYRDMNTKNITIETTETRIYYNDTDEIMSREPFENASGLDFLYNSS